MSKKISIQLPLSGTLFGGLTFDETFIIQPPCFYCEAPVDIKQEHFYVQKGQYKIQYWGRGQKFGTAMLGDVVDSKGQKLMGKYSIKLPYCLEHITPYKPFAVINIVAFALGILGGLGLMALIYINEGLEFGEFLILLFGLPFFLVSLFLVIGLVIKAIIAKLNPKLKDYSKSNGHYGVTISGVTTSGGEAMVGPITYSLTMAITNPNSARRFLQACPQAQVIKGEELLSIA